MGKHRQRSQEEQQDQAYAAGQQSMQAEAAPPAPAAPSAAAPAGGISEADVSRLQDLAKLHEQGVLTDDEFSQQKALILGG